MAFVKLQHKNTNSIGVFVLKNGFNVQLKDFWYTEINLTQMCITNKKN